MRGTILKILAYIINIFNNQYLLEIRRVLMKRLQSIYFSTLLFLVLPFPGIAMEIPSSFNPTGSGARAVGINAFIGIADDVTAASWNPGGLVRQEDLFELSFVVAYLYRTEDHTMGDNPVANLNHSVSDFNVNYLGMMSTFEAYGKNMSVALSLQHLYDFNRSWKFPYHEFLGVLTRKENWNYEQTGALSALGLSYCIELIKPDLSLGFTLNIWDDNISPNHWKQTYHMTGTRKLLGSPLREVSYDKTEDFSFDGINMNFGLMWNINYKFSLGAIVKTPFKADIKHSIKGKSVDSEVRHEHLEMPLSYGIGMVYRFSDQFYMSADLYKTHWDDFVYIDKDGKKTCPISDGNYAMSDIKPTYQVRAGIEYLKLYPNHHSAIPFRLGVFYDPAPEKHNPDDFWGISLGTGWIKNNIGSIDIAYMFRLGNDVASSTLEDLDFSQDVQEHMVYVSVISYFY
jgi:hypothetical protein